MTYLRTWSRTAVTLGLLAVGVTVVGHAAVVAAPEIDASAGVNALALLSGAFLIIRGRKQK